MPSLPGSALPVKLRLRQAGGSLPPLPDPGTLQPGPGPLYIPYPKGALYLQQERRKKGQSQGCPIAEKQVPSPPT